MQFRLGRFALRCITRPHLLALLPGAAWRFRARGWWRRPPFLPLPPADYIRWRLHTAFGNEQAEPDIDDLEAYLAWAARMRKQPSREARRRPGA
ncbi:MAG TPA: hypothetical protein VF021_12660 [Longimicrobiales bacterium]